MCLTCFVDWVEGHQGFIQSVLAFALISVTIIYARSTGKIARANRDLVTVTEKMAEATSMGLLMGIAPVITAKAAGWVSGSSGITYKVHWTNTGKGAANNVELEVTLGLDENSYRVRHDAVFLMKPDQLIEGYYPLNEAASKWLYQREGDVETTFHAKYTDALGQRFESTQKGTGNPIVFPLETSSQDPTA